MNGKLHDAYYIIDTDTGLPVPGTEKPWPTIVECHARNMNIHEGRGRYQVRVWTPAPKYCAPIGTAEERASGKIWPGAWIDATGYLTWYFAKWWHTGADLNLNAPAFDADAHAPVYAIADGHAYAVQAISGWGNVICIRHDDCLSRYGHVENIRITQGDTVLMGQHIADIGNAGGRFPYHLHMDIAKLDARMATVPGDWPGADKSRVIRDYLDPKAFLQQKVRAVHEPPNQG